VLHRIALLAIAAPKRVIAVAILVMIGAAAFGVPVAKSLSSGGFQDPTSESASASHLLADKFGQSDMQLLFTVTAQDGATSAQARDAGVDIVNRLKESPHVLSLMSPWTSPPAAAADLISRDGKSGLIVAGIGVSMSMPAVQNAVLSSVNPVEMGKASGVFNMGRFLGGMFGVALLVAVFSGTGAIGSAAGFSTGFASAMRVAAALSLLGALAGLFLPARKQVATAPTPQNA